MSRCGLSAPLGVDLDSCGLSRDLRRCQSNLRAVHLPSGQSSAGPRAVVWSAVESTTKRRQLRRPLRRSRFGCGPGARRCRHLLPSESQFKQSWQFGRPAGLVTIRNSRCQRRRAEGSTRRFRVRERVIGEAIVRRRLPVRTLSTTVLRPRTRRPRTITGRSPSCRSRWLAVAIWPASSTRRSVCHRRRLDNRRGHLWYSVDRRGPGHDRHDESEIRLARICAGLVRVDDESGGDKELTASIRAASMPHHRSVVPGDEPPMGCSTS